MRLRIIEVTYHQTRKFKILTSHKQLENTLESQPPAKRRKVSEVPEEKSSEATSTKAVDRATAKADAKKVEVLLKRFWASYVRLKI